MWPAAAGILDPVRVSVVVGGPARILEVVGWFTGEGGDRGDGGSSNDDNGSDSDGCSGGRARCRAAAVATGLPVCRVKNKFGLREEELVGGYRDVLLSVVFVGGEGLGIIGEIQARICGGANLLLASPFLAP